MSGDDDLLAHLERTSGLQRHQAERLVDEVLAFFAETAESYVRRRHRELQREGLANPAIFARIGEELERRRVAAPPYTERQLRRLVYG